MFMSENNYVPSIIKTIEGKNVVWFQKTNQYIIMEAPAYAILVLFNGGLKKTKIIEWFSLKYMMSYEEAKKSVSQTLKIIKSQNTKQNPPGNNQVDLTCSTPVHLFYSQRFYTFNKNEICFYFETKEIEALFLDHFKYLASSGINCTQSYYLYKINGYYVVKDFQKVIGFWQQPKIHFFKGKVFMLLLNNGYGTEDKDWMAVFHAAAICNGKESIIFPGKSGAGKSTLSALLKLNGFDVYSDDFVPVDIKTGKVAYFPATVALKNSATDVWYSANKDSEGRSASVQKNIDQTVYIKNILTNNPKKPVYKVVFLNYSKNTGFAFNPLTTCEALKRLIPESWLCPVFSNVEVFFNWFSSKLFFEMTYSDNSKMIKR